MQSRSQAHKIEESILSKSGVGATVTFVNNIVRITKSYYDNRAKISNEDKELLERLWKERDLEIPGMKWYFTRFSGLQYGPENGLCVPIVQIHNNDGVNISIRSRKGIDYAIKSLNLPTWEDVAKKETKKMTDAFLRKYDKKLSNALGMNSVEENDFLISRYELD